MHERTDTVFARGNGWRSRDLGSYAGQIEHPNMELYLREIPEATIDMELRAHCAYNETRGYFLGLDIIAGDFSGLDLGEMLSRLALKPNEGLWLTPFLGLPLAALCNPFDLVYLDDNCSVIESIASFPIFHSSSSLRPATSALILPLNTICSTQTQIGDRLLLCGAEKMEGLFDLLASHRKDSRVVIGAALLRDQPIWSGANEIREQAECGEDESNGLVEAFEMSLVEPTVKSAVAPIDHPARWWSPDPLSIPPKLWPGPAAYYWNNAIPRPGASREINATDSRLLREDRWYPGTLVLMMLRSTDAWIETAERSISVVSRAVRRGIYTVSVQFVLDNELFSRIERSPKMYESEDEEFARFLKKLVRVRV